jgi:hypothetical protein
VSRFEDSNRERPSRIGISSKQSTISLCSGSDEQKEARLAVSVPNSENHNKAARSHQLLPALLPLSSDSSAEFPKRSVLPTEDEEMAQLEARPYRRLGIQGFPWVLCDTAKNGRSYASARNGLLHRSFPRAARASRTNICHVSCETWRCVQRLRSIANCMDRGRLARPDARNTSLSNSSNGF